MMIAALRMRRRANRKCRYVSAQLFRWTMRTIQLDANYLCVVYFVKCRQLIDKTFIYGLPISFAKKP